MPTWMEGHGMEGRWASSSSESVLGTSYEESEALELVEFDPDETIRFLGTTTIYGEVP